MANAMDATVAICTYNRSRLLSQTLETIAQVQVSDDVSWEVLVVDNNSDDDTAAVLKQFEDRLPLRSLLERRPGKSHAANTASRRARGSLIVWTDDDVLVEPGWLQVYCEASRRHPDVGIFGGPIKPWFEGEPPEWLTQVFPLVANAYAVLDLGDQPLPLSHDVYPYGANMALRRELHIRRPFDTCIGPNPEAVMRGEEMVLVRELLAEGESGLWVPGALVRHYIPESRQTVEYLRSYFTGAGRLLDYLEDPPGLRLLGRPLWLWRQAIESEALYRLHRSFGKPERWILDLRSASVSWGRIRGFKAPERPFD